MSFFRLGKSNIIEKTKKQKLYNNKNILFIIFAVFAISIFAIAVSPVELQNDTFYTIKIGKYIIDNGIDMMDHFSWHNSLPYTYPHWLYDVCIYLIYNIAGFTGIYVSTIILAIILGLLIFLINRNINKTNFISFLISIGSLYLIKDYIAARAQLVTFILFILAIFCIEKFMQGNRKKLYGTMIIFISLLIANIHVAVWPFLFILFLPHLSEQFIIWLYNLKIWNKLIVKFNDIKIQKSKRNGKGNEIKSSNLKVNNKETKEQIIDDNIKTYKIIFSKNKNIKYLIIVLILSVLIGFITPLKDVPFTYLYKTMIGNTTQSINEHLPLTLIENKPIMFLMMSIIAIIMLTKVKIRFKDLCMIFGLMVLCFISKRQTSLFIVIGNIYITKIFVDALKNNKFLNIKNIEKHGTSILSILILLILVVLISWLNIKDKIDDKYINENNYPVEATKYIKETLINKVGVENLKLFNEYNYGSYLLLNDIPVFIDSRADLYAPEFNGVKNDDGIYEGRDIFSDFINVSSMNSYYEMIFDKYDINYVILYRATKLNIILCRDENYDIEYIDDNFVVYKRNVCIYD